MSDCHWVKDQFFKLGLQCTSEKGLPYWRYKPAGDFWYDWLSYGRLMGDDTSKYSYEDFLRVILRVSHQPHAIPPVYLKQSLLPSSEREIPVPDTGAWFREDEAWRWIAGLEYFYGDEGKWKVVYFLGGCAILCMKGEEYSACVNRHGVKDLICWVREEGCKEGYDWVRRWTRGTE